ncbi:hypothetical protein GOBAR_DD00726 [Gossypium barbadense]|nr:hypothetical protein GOBAR_DD00726 [Gossypium barbadense]
MPYLQLAGCGDMALVQKVLEPSVACNNLLGQSFGDEEENFMTLKFSLLSANFKNLLSIATKNELKCTAQAYVLQLLEGVLMPDGTSNKVHLMYLPLLEISPVLMGHISRYWHEQDIIMYCKMIEASAGDKWVHAKANVWCINTPVLNFSTIEWYNVDRVIRQFGCKQFVLNIPPRFDDVHGSQSNAYHPKMGGCSSNYEQLQSPMMFDMSRSTPIGDTMYSTLHPTTFDPMPDLLDVFNTPQQPRHQQRPVNRYTSNGDTTPDSFQFYTCKFEVLYHIC